MIMDFNKEVDEILKALDVQHDALDQRAAMDLMAICFKLFDRGMGFERERVIPIIQRMAIDPMTIVREIRKPIR